MKSYNRQDLSPAGIVGCCLAIVVFAIAWTFALAFVLQLAWNAVVPSLFGGPTIEYYQSLAIVFIASIIGSLFRSSITVSK